MSNIRQAHVAHPDTVEAARAFHKQVGQPDMSLVLFFCSSHYDLEALAAEFRQLFGSVPIVGCTTAGEIGEAGYHSHSITGISFPGSHFNAATGLLGPLQSCEVGEARDLTQSLRRRLAADGDTDAAGADFAFLMVDGLSTREEVLVGALQNSLGDIPLVGGSAGDDLRFEQTFVFHDGQFHHDHAVVVLVHSLCPVMPWKTQHFVATDQRLVITQAYPEQRRVTEINGLPAASEYARLTGVDVNDLSPDRFASSPVVVLVNGREYVRSIQRVQADGSLIFFCAIEQGLVMRVARGVDPVETLSAQLNAIHEQLGEPQVVLAFDCILRRLELIQSDLIESASALARRHNIVGFSSYGEQFEGVHVNQTFTALAIGHPDGEDAL